MKLNMGVRIDEDEKYDPSKEARANLNDAGRDRSETEKGLDDMLFGKGAARRRSRAPEQPVEKPQSVASTQKSSNSHISQPVTETPFQNHRAPKVDISSPGHKMGETLIDKGKEKTQKSELKAAGSAITGKSNFINPFDFNAESRLTNSAEISNLFNRPATMRKLKKIAENLPNYCWDNSNNYYTDVVRLGDCKLDAILKKKTANFHDLEFPACGISVGPRHRKDDSISWHRANEYLGNSLVFGKYSDPNDFQLGAKSSANFISILSCLAERESNIKKLIGNQIINKDGFYWVRLFINSVWKYYSVDDYLPHIDGEPLCGHGISDRETELSISLIEKAYAKAFGGYHIFERTATAQEYLRDLTGSIITLIDPSDASLLSKFDEALENSWTIVAVPNAHIIELGISPQFNLGVINITDRNSIELRNSWGTITERPALAFTREGLFQLGINELHRYFSHFLIAETSDHRITSTVQSRHLKNFYSCYTFRISRTLHGHVSISQWERRLFPETANYRSTPFRVILERRYAKKNPEYVAARFSYQSESMNLPVELLPGDYALYCIGSWDNSNHDYNICVSGNQRVQLTKEPTTRAPNLIKQCLEPLNLREGKRSAKGHVDEHIMYHHDSNLVLLTVTNISDKQYSYTQDLSRIKFDTLQVLNAASPDEPLRYAGLMKAELASIRANNNAQRVWSITLQPHDHYTWVISTSEDYREENFRTWGFK